MANSLSAVAEAPSAVTTVSVSEGFDHQGFAREISNLNREIVKTFSIEDVKHLQRIEFAGKCCTLAAYVFCGLATLTNPWFLIPFAALLFSHGLLTRWLLAHHICHGGYDKVPGAPARYRSKVFAHGWRRYLDWFDWIHPEGWRYEHDFLHHYYTGEDHDPDLVERNAALLRGMPIPKFLKYVILFLVAITWKFTYYAANTLNALEGRKNMREATGHVNHIHLLNFLDFRKALVRRFWFSSLMPYFAFHFVLMPGLFYVALGPVAGYAALIARVLGEFAHNLHMFMVIVPNHAGDDLCKYNYHYKNRSDFYLGQIMGSVNFHCGNGWLDLSQMWLNYQIEHHLFPRLPLLAYRKIQPEVKAICEKYGVPYIQENVFKRVKKLIDISVGSTNMIAVDSAEQLHVQVGG